MSPIRTLVVVASLLLTVAACGSKTGVAGTYELDASGMKASMDKLMQEQLAKLPEDQREAAKSMMGGMMPDFSKVKGTMTLNADGTATSVGTFDGKTEEKGTGTWKQEGQKVTVSMKKDGEATAEPMAMDIRGNDLVATQEQQGVKMELVFRRK